MTIAKPIWLPEVQSNWDLIPLKRLCTIETGTADTQDAAPDGSYDFVIRSPRLKQASTYTFDCKAIVTAGDGAVGEVFHYMDGPFLAHQRTYVLHSFQGIDARYLFYFFSSHFRFMCQDGSAKTTVDSVRRWMLTDMPILVPPVNCQKRIAHFLDTETAKIDHLIAKQRELITLTESRLKLWRERTFWGEVQTEDPFLNPPTGWKVLRNRHLLEHVDARSETGDEEMLSVSHITGVTPRSMKNVNMFEAESTVGYKLVAKNELVINTMWAWMGALGVSAYEGIVSPAYNVYRFRDLDAVNPMYFDCMYRTDAYVSLMKAHSRGIWESRLRLYPEVFLRLSSLVPPKDVQDRLVAKNNERTTEAEKLIIRCHKAIELLQERRSALITAAVTGQIEV